YNNKARFYAVSSSTTNVNLALKDTSSFQEGTLKADIHFTNTTSTEDALILFGNDGGTYSYALRVSKSSGASVSYDIIKVRQSDGLITTLGSTTGSVAKDVTGPYKVTISITGKAITATVKNGALTTGTSASYTATTLNSDKVGIAVERSSGSVQFDDLSYVVTGASTPTTDTFGDATAALPAPWDSQYSTFGATQTWLATESGLAQTTLQSASSSLRGILKSTTTAANYAEAVISMSSADATAEGALLFRAVSSTGYAAVFSKNSNTITLYKYTNSGSTLQSLGTYSGASVSDYSNIRIAGAYDSSDGYIKVYVNGKLYIKYNDASLLSGANCGFAAGKLTSGQVAVKDVNYVSSFSQTPENQSFDAQTNPLIGYTKAGTSSTSWDFYNNKARFYAVSSSTTNVNLALKDTSSFQEGTLKADIHFTNTTSTEDA
ncbi:MAG: hypothetical protein Q7N50_16195, partial [Armatimonadota bacterium]|nr:hypothetical protein [Armatimonadota bacterium]